LKTTLKAEIDPEAWGTLPPADTRDVRQTEERRIAVKVINHWRRSNESIQSGLVMAAAKQLSKKSDSSLA